ncbi:MAG: hypothetical protein M0Z61_05905 [Nitrospiraceae bacterium]|nr:hypothetical protein [Nitrospiraceae bacterium]
MNRDGRKKSLYPDYLPFVLVAVLIALEAIITPALLFPPRVGPAIDLTAPYQPRPDWYFLWLYQLLRYFPGRWAVLGTVALPALFILVLMFMPYIDRGKNGRKKALWAGWLLFAALAVLTLIPVLTQR